MEEQKRIRMKFSATEDTTLKKLVHESGDDVNWKFIAESMGKGRTARQCRERFRNYLSPKLRNGPWTPEEEALLEEKYMMFGPKWAKMSTFFKGRSDVNLKNHWASILNRRSKEAFSTNKNGEVSTAKANHSDLIRKMKIEQKELDSSTSNNIVQTEISEELTDTQLAELEEKFDYFELDDIDFSFFNFDKVNDLFIFENETSYFPNDIQ